jgi:hypothetical protein
VLHQAPGSGLSGQLSLALRRGNLLCSAPSCASHEAVRCFYRDRRQRQCESAWCRDHQRLAFGAIYCRRHAGIINALGPDHASLPLPDLENRAPSLANWIGRDLNGPIRDLLATHFPGHPLNVSGVVNGGGLRDRTWGRSWKLISATGVDLSISVNVPEAQDSVVRVIYEGRLLLELMPPWIEARTRVAGPLDPHADYEARCDFYSRIVEDLETAIVATKADGRYVVEGL